MNSTVVHRLTNRKILSIPLPAFTVAYAVIESAEKLTIVCAMKTNANLTPSEILKRAQMQFKNLKWQYGPDPGSRGHSGGAASDYEYYSLQKTGDFTYVLLGNDEMGHMSNAFTSPLSGSNFSALNADQEKVKNLLKQLESVTAGPVPGP